MRQIGKTITTASDHRIVFVAQEPTASWIAEGEEIPFSNEKFGQVKLDAFKLAVHLKISNELLQDSFYNLEEHLLSEFSKSFARAEEDSFLNGAPDPLTGNTKQPTGILNRLAQSASSFIQTTTSGEISADDILTLIYSLGRPYRKDAVFLVSDSTMMMLRKIKDSNGRFVLDSNMQEGEPPRLFGQPILTSQFMPAPASGSVPMIYGDFKNYCIIGERGSRYSNRYAKFTP